LIVSDSQTILMWYFLY